MKEHRARVAVCAIVKNEAENLLEWVAYYSLLGVDLICIYDNFSDDAPADLLAKAVSEGLVRLIPWKRKPGQLEAYDHFAANFGVDFDWAIFVDADEYVHLLNGLSLREFLSQFDKYSGIALQWRNFGPSGHVARPPGLTIENYDHRLPDDSYPAHGHVKSIIRMRDYINAVDPHSFNVKGIVVDETGVPVVPTVSEKHYSIQPILAHRQACINHYYTRSESDWRKKVNRGFADHADDALASRPEHILEFMRSQAIVRDDTLKVFSERLKVEMMRLRVG